MRLVVQSPTHPERIIGTLEDLVGEDTAEIRLSVAYVTMSGLQILVERLTEKLGVAKWDTMRKRLITCIDYGITEPKAMAAWSALPLSSLHVHNVDLIESTDFNPKIAFHIKMYEFRTDTKANLMIGSANLSERALIFNSEAVSVHVGVSNLKALDGTWKRMRAGAVVASAALIEAYDVARAKHPPLPPPPIPVPSGNPSQSLLEAINTAACDPAAYEYFWVDAGYLSGGSQNQLELPRGANRYFGFNFGDYHLLQAPIGTVDLAVRSAVHSERPLSWHGDNRMERVNLPTGFNYAGNVMLFRRRSTWFDLTWTPIGSERAVAWAGASAATGERYWVGRTGGRVCGLF
jgi:HKD family nuclease